MSPTPAADAGPCIGGQLNMPDPSIQTTPSYSLAEAEDLVLTGAGEAFGVDPSSLSLANEYLETVEQWGAGVLWYIGKIFWPDSSDGDYFYVDVVSGEVIRSAEYNSCWDALVALGGPFELPPTRAPSWSPGPGLLGYAPAKPYLDQPIAPELQQFNPPEPPPFDDLTLAAIYERISPLITTFNGQRYDRAIADFNCSQVECYMYLEAWLPNAASLDRWSFKVGRHGDKAEPFFDDWWVEPLQSVPHDAVEELLAIVALDDEASARAASYSDFSFASWDPDGRDRLSVTYGSSGGATTHYLTIKIDIATRHVVGYSEAERDG